MIVWLGGGRRTDAWVVRAYQEAQHSDILQTFNEYVGKQKMIVWPGGSPDFMRAVAAASAERERAGAGWRHSQTPGQEEP